jgi:hypothetical protein
VHIDPPAVRASAAALRRGGGATVQRVPLPSGVALPAMLQATLRRVRDRERGVTSQVAAAFHHHAAALDRLAGRAERADAPVVR